MIIKRFVWEPRDTNMYVIEEGNHILIIDPNDNEDVLKTCIGTHSVTVLLTHEHYDHICGLNKLRKLGGQASVEGINSLVVVANKNCSSEKKSYGEKYGEESFQKHCFAMILKIFFQRLNFLAGFSLN